MNKIFLILSLLTILNFSHADSFQSNLNDPGPMGGIIFYKNNYGSNETMFLSCTQWQNNICTETILLRCDGNLKYCHKTNPFPLTKLSEEKLRKKLIRKSVVNSLSPDKPFNLTSEAFEGGLGILAIITLPVDIITLPFVILEEPYNAIFTPKIARKSLEFLLEANQVGVFKKVGQYRFSRLHEVFSDLSVELNKSK